MRKHKCNRLVAVSTLSAEEKSPGQDRFTLFSFILVAIVRIFVRAAYNNIVNSARVLEEESGKDEDGNEVVYTLARVPILTMKDRESVKTVAGYVGDGKTGLFLSRYAAAEFFVDQIEGKEWLNKAPAISSVSK